MILTPRFSPPYALTLTALSVLVMALAVVSVIIGPSPLDPLQALGDVLARRETLDALILMDLRLPRALLGILAGFSLGITGAAMQGLLRNPLAEPGVLGVSGAAALGAVVVFYSGLAGAFAFALPLGGMAGAALASIALYIMAGRGAGTMTLVLAGVAINSLAGALTSLALNLSSNPFAAMEIVFWMMGSLADRSMDDVLLVLAPMLAGWLLLLAAGPALDGLSLGEDAARSLGFTPERLRAQLVTGAALAVGSAVAVTGLIGFVGLVVPHLVRGLAGGQPARVLLPSGLAGAALLLAADIGLRLLPIRPELQPGVVTAIIGAPFLLVLIRRLHREA